MAQLTQFNKTVLKDSPTNNKLQSAVMPIFQSAETKIKALIVLYFWLNKSKSELRLKIIGIVRAIKTKLPPELPNHDAYLNGILRKSDILIRNYFDKPMANFKQATTMLNKVIDPTKIKKVPDIKSPKELVEFVSKTPASHF